MSDPARTVKVGQIAVHLGDPPTNKGQITCGRHVAIDVGYAGAYRVYSELKMIREALGAAHAVLTARTNAGQTSAVEVTLARLLVDLEITS